MTRLTVQLARTAIKATERTSLAGLGCGFGFGVSDEHMHAAEPEVRFREALIERGDAPRFLAMFPELELDGLRVLDFGCGYGGKTVEFGRTAEFVVGVEPLARHIDLARQYARWREAGNVEFRLCAQSSIPGEDDEFDLVLSHDVIEHVDDPFVSLGEIHRVLRPGGRAFIVFPPYWGAKSHHLDYATQIPAIHWLFSPETLVSAVNSLGREDIPMQPPPRPRWSGGRRTLPTLNGLSGSEFRRIAGEKFAIERIHHSLLGSGGHNFVAKAFHIVAAKPLSMLGGLPRDLVTGSIVAILKKPRAPDSGIGDQ